MFNLNLKKKTVDKFDFSESVKWTMLMKPIIQDLPRFIHFCCYYAEDKTVAAFTIYEGFIKEGRFIPEKHKNYKYPDYFQAHIAFQNAVKRYLDAGYMRHDEMYLDGNPGKPPYIPDDPKLEEEGEDLGKVQAAIKTLKGNGITGAAKAVLHKIRPHLKLPAPTVINLNQNTNTEEDEEQASP